MTAPHQRRARSGRDVRILRAAVFAAVCVVLAAGGHTLASCAPVPPWTLVAGFLGVLLVTVPLTGRERSLPGIAALLAAGQTVLHTLFGLGQHTATSGMSMASMTSASDASLVRQAARITCGAAAAAISPAQARRILTDARIAPAPTMDMSSMRPAGSPSLGSLLPSLPMLLGHVLAAVAAGWLLRRGDLALLRLVELSADSLADGALVRSLRSAFALVRALRAGLPGAPEAGPRVRRTTPLASPGPRTAALQHTVIRRGPPAAAPFLLAA
ncbi:hypothetical protein [Streptomyces panaciradicis]|uniref:hypothetical protein n=1 Tax=Streptomyces panaciradicis TaxID=1470261 RepID=UPI00201CC059|nr:hypothetical protein [Streptomyces panaciradicis]MCL6668266.1 hypothetical protein [Streptomyces panaciradicis]